MAVYSYENGEFKEVSTGGGHQITQDETVAKPNLYGLDAIENNPDVEGTLANDIKGLKEKDTTTDAEILGINEKLETVETLKETVGTIEVSVREITTLKETIEAQKKTIETLNTTITTQAATIKEHTATLKTLSGLIDNQTTYRGKNLGKEVTAEQLEAIRYGKFTDMYLGDYWYMEDIDWKIVDFNYWYNCGNVNSMKYHLVIMPHQILYRYQANETYSTKGGYAGSDLYINGLTQAKEMINRLFPNMLYVHEDYLVSGVTNGKPTAHIGDKESTVQIPSEVMMYGHNIVAARNDGVAKYYEDVTNKTQLALFRVRPQFIDGAGSPFWLRDVVDDESFAVKGNFSNATKAQANQNYGVKPVFGICYNS